MVGPVAARQPFYKILYVQVLVAILIGIVLGYFFPTLGTQMKPLGDAFIKIIKMVIAPVIFLTIVSGIAGMTDLEKVGRVGAKALGYFLAFSTVALILGLVIGNVVQPGAGRHINPADLDPKRIANFVQAAKEQSVVEFLMKIIPDTVVGAFSSGEILQVVFFSLLFGIAVAMMGERGKPILTLVQTLSKAMFGVVAIIMKVAPIGAFGAMAYTIGAFGIATILSLLWLVGTFYLTAFLFVFGVLGLMAYANGFSIWALVKYISSELWIVLGTSSSESALPLLIDKMERAGCPKPVVGLVIPTGYSFNLDGTCIYMTMASLFIAQATDTPLSLGDQILLLAVAMLSSKGAAGVAGSGFITLAATLSVVPAVPLVGMVLIFGVDRFMSECRSLTNFVGNAVATIVVSNWEGELDRERLNAALSGAAPPVPLGSELPVAASNPGE